MRMINLGSAALLSAVLLVPVAAWAGGPPNLANRWNQTAVCDDINQAVGANEASIQATGNFFSTSGNVVDTAATSGETVRICYGTELSNRGTASNARGSDPNNPRFRASSAQRRASLLEVAFGTGCTSSCGSVSPCVVHTARPDRGRVNGAARERNSEVGCRTRARFALSDPNAFSPVLAPRDVTDLKEAYSDRSDVRIRGATDEVSRIAIRHRGLQP